MENYRCRFCGEIVELSEAKTWWHIQKKHPAEYEAIKERRTPEMVNWCYVPTDAKYSRKTALVTPAFACEMIADLEKSGCVSQNGDRESRYFPIAMGREERRHKRVEAALIEEASDLPRESAGYSIHVIDDVDGVDCKTFTTEHLDEGELVALLSEILNKLGNGYL